MYGIPTDVDLSFFSNATLQQVCIGENEVILHFDSDIMVMVTSTICVTSADGLQTAFTDAKAGGATLLNLLGNAVRVAMAGTDGTLKLTWKGGDILEILDTWKEFESYTVRHGESLLVV